jgi:putative endonuclease
MRGKRYYVYIMTNKWNTTLYTGVTDDLKRRVYQHEEKLIEGFTKRYNVGKLVYYEVFGDPESAIRREKQIKAGPRRRERELVGSVNRDWRDLYEEI